VGTKVTEPTQELVVEPDETPFTVPPLEGMPFDDGSLEDEAIRRIVDEPDL